MSIYYAPSTSGIYDTSFAEYSLPADAVEITSEQQSQIASGGYSVAVSGGVVTLTPVVVNPWPPYQAQAQALLTDSDRTILRCYENGVPVPADLASYRKALRAIVSAPSGDATQPLPVRPAYPEGT